MSETAIIVPAAHAEAAVSRFRRDYTGAGAEGMPTHVTLLYPLADTRMLVVGHDPDGWRTMYAIPLADG